MLKHLKQVVRESVKEIALSLFISSLFILSFFFFLEKKVNVVFSLLNTITITEKKEEDTTLSFDNIKKRLKSLYFINIESPNEKKRYFSFTAS